MASWTNNISWELVEKADFLPPPQTHGMNVWESSPAVRVYQAIRGIPVRLRLNLLKVGTSPEFSWRSTQFSALVCECRLSRRGLLCPSFSVCNMGSGALHCSFSGLSWGKPKREYNAEHMKHRGLFSYLTFLHLQREGFIPLTELFGSRKKIMEVNRLKCCESSCSAFRKSNSITPIFFLSLLPLVEPQSPENVWWYHVQEIGHLSTSGRMVTYPAVQSRGAMTLPKRSVHVHCHVPANLCSVVESQSTVPCYSLCLNHVFFQDKLPKAWAAKFSTKWPTLAQGQPTFNLAWNLWPVGPVRKKKMN